MASSSLWQRFQRHSVYYRDLDFSLDISRLKLPADFLEKIQPKIGKAFAAMRELEAGAIANPAEKRMVGYYRLRSPALATTPELRTEIEQTIQPHQKIRRRYSRRKNHAFFSRTSALMYPIYGR